MQPDQYRSFTDALTRNLAQSPQVLGLVALGSMADRDYGPDPWSDHDFFIITTPGAQEAFRTDLGWLPDRDGVAFWFRETAHGVKVVYGSGHLLEFAVFDENELDLARVNRYRVLLDRSHVTARIEHVAARTTRETTQHQASDQQVMGQFLTNLLVGVARFWRGERLSGHQFVKSYSMEHLVLLLTRHVPASRRELLDNLSPLRRFEMVYPALAAELDAIACLAPPEAALRLLDLAERALPGAMPNYPGNQVAVIRQYLTHMAENQLV